MPDDADWDPADIRYSTIRWMIHPGSGYAVGPSRANPVSGELYDADIRISADFVRGFYREFDEFDVEDFDWKKLIWLKAHGIEEFGPTGEEYQFSEIFYADEKYGITRLDKIITDFDLKSTEAEFSWPTDE